jgi:hypothetical protein
MKDSTNNQMACLHAYQSSDPAVWSGDQYYGVYQSKVGTEFEVRLARSNDLMQWNFVRTLIANADMPFIKQANGSSWLLLTHEQWMTKGSRVPSRLGFKLYYNESQLFQGVHFNSFIAPLSVGKVHNIEGTPNIYDAQMVKRNNMWVVDASIGFHFNSKKGVDQVASGTLTSFGPTDMQPAFSGQHKDDAYDQLFINKGAIGNIGQRKAGTVLGTHICTQEVRALIISAPPYTPPTITPPSHHPPPLSSGQCRKDAAHHLG